MRVVPALAVVVTALALYMSGAVLDQIFTADGLVRVALLPPWQALIGFLGVGAIGLLWLYRRSAPRSSAAARRVPLSTLVLPAFALIVLLLPYLPVLPDILPAVQILAGPLRFVLWLVIIAQFAWALWQWRVIHVDALQRLTTGQAMVLVAVATAAMSGFAASRLTSTVLYPGGDEPHYLVIAQSLWRDGDLKIENNHTRGDYYEYFGLELAPHYLTRGADEEIYSIHPVGMPVLMAPVYAAGGYGGVVFVFVLMAAVAAALMWRTTLRVTNDVGAATFGWAAVAATSPFLFNSFAIYPEIPAAVAVAIAFHLIAVSSSRGWWRWAAVGMACALLPWFSTKYAPMSAALILIALARMYYAPGAAGPTQTDLAARGHAANRTELAGPLALLLPYAVSLAAWFYFFYAIWGVPLPQAPYGALVQTELKFLIFGAPGLLVDQEYGLLPYAPVYVLAATGLFVMLRRDAASRRQAIEIILIFGALMGTVGAFRIWWGGSASPGRPITSGLLLLAIPMAFAFRAAAAGTAQRAAQHLLLWTSIGIAGVLLFAQQGLLLANGRDGTSALLEYLSPRWPAWTMVPSFIYHEPQVALLHTAAWILLAVVAAMVLKRMSVVPRPGAASLMAVALCAIMTLVAAVVMPRVPASPAWPQLDVRARARLPLLDEFDRVARPIAIEYSPFSVEDPAALITHSPVIVEPHWRTQPQPVRVLHNGRFSLPAGTYRVEIDWSGSRPAEDIGLQIGRIGDPLERWTVVPEAGTQWTHEFTVPVDAPFVGLRGTSEIERVIGRVRFVPLSVVNAGERLRAPAVIAASRSGPATLFYYDTFVSPEADGLWVWGERSTRVTIARPSAGEPIVLRVHSGPQPNRLHVSKFGWRTSVDLQPEVPATIEVPSDGETLVTLQFAADRAFVPRDLDSSSTDTRPLGVWVEVIK